MSRETQYIGLTPKAEEFVKDLKKVENSGNCTSGMFGERVELGEWWDEQRKVYVREVVQAEPWSSGPMIFTTLAFALEKAECEIHESEDGTDWHFTNSKELEFLEGLGWEEDSSVKGEVDYENGKFWV